MPTREETYGYVSKIIDQALEDFGGQVENVWLGIYQALLWYEGQFIHVIDADKLRPTKRRSANLQWQRRAKALEKFLAERFLCESKDIRSRIDLLMAQSDFAGQQRQNPLGTGFIGAIQYVLRKFGGSSLTFAAEVAIKQVFKGQDVPGRTKNAKIDIVAFRHNIPRAIVSCKWSVRHDRINDITNECPAYKSAAETAFSLVPKFFLVTNEFDPARLTKILQDECIDGVVHVHKEAVTEVCGLDGRLARLLDLSTFVQQSNSW